VPTTLPSGAEATSIVQVAPGASVPQVLLAAYPGLAVTLSTVVVEPEVFVTVTVTASDTVNADCTEKPIGDGETLTGGAMSGSIRATTASLGLDT
jgi:hypothetical protein